MPAWAIIIICVAALLLLVGVLLTLPLQCRIRYQNEAFTVTYRFVFLRGVLYPEPEPLVKGKRKKKKKSAGVKKEAAQEPPKNPLLGLQLKEVLSFLLDLLKSFHGNFKGKLIFKIRKLHVTVGADDAARCAMLYGAASGAIAHFLEAIRYFFTLKAKDKKAVRVTADFAGHSGAEADILIYVNILRVLHTRLKGIKEELQKELDAQTQSEEENDANRNRKDKEECLTKN